MLGFLYLHTGPFSENTLHASHSLGVRESGSPALLRSLGYFAGRNTKKQISSQSLSFAELLLSHDAHVLGAGQCVELKEHPGLPCQPSLLRGGEGEELG